MSGKDDKKPSDEVDLTLSPVHASTKRKAAGGEGAAPSSPNKRQKGAAKLEEGTSEAWESQFIELCEKNPKGLHESELNAKLSHIPLKDRAQIINSLMQRSRVSLYKEGNSIVYKIIGAEEAEKFRNLTAHDMLIYQLIERSGNMGVWIRDIRKKSNLQQALVTKILRTLETRKLVKCEKSVASGNTSKKVYMLYELEPAKEVTGGVWYSDANFDQEFINELYKTCLTFVQSKGEATAGSVWEFVKQSGVFTVTCALQDIQTILLSMHYDGAVTLIGGEYLVTDVATRILTSGEDEASRKKVDASGRVTQKADSRWEGVRYRYNTAGVTKTSFASIPCASCPVARLCSEHGIINPKTCQYLTSWMEF